MNINYFFRKEFKRWVDEYQEGVRFVLKGKLITEERSKFQKITIFESNNYPMCKEISNRQLTLPLYPTMRDKDVNYVCDSLREIINE